MKCACNDPKCKSEIYIDTSLHTLLITSEFSRDVMIYLDANLTAEIIKQLKESLLHTIEE